MPLRQAAALNHARHRGGFHFAANFATAQARMKFAVAHNILAPTNPPEKRINFSTQ